MHHNDGHQLYMPQDVRQCSVCRNWVELSEFRKRTGGGIAPECRECHNSIRAAQRRRQTEKSTRFSDSRSETEYYPETRVAWKNVFWRD